MAFDLRDWGAAAFAVAIIGFATILFMGAGSADGAGKRGGGCANATAPAAQAPTNDLRKAIQCLINEERTSRGRSELDRDRKLQSVAGKHVKKMVETDCLDHVCGDEASVEKRIRNTGYFSGARSFDFGEDVGCESTPESMVKNWMNSTIHRKNILTRKFDDIGVAANNNEVESGACAPDYGTFVVIFGYRAG